jgi:hypothetical protein
MRGSPLETKGIRMNRFAGIVVSFGLAAGSACAERVAPAVFHVDSQAGNDGADGSTPKAAWRTLDKVNAADLIPGDQVLFKRGGLWRGRLEPKSGNESAPVRYARTVTGPSRSCKVRSRATSPRVERSPSRPVGHAQAGTAPDRPTGRPTRRGMAPAS